MKQTSFTQTEIFSMFDYQLIGAIEAFNKESYEKATVWKDYFQGKINTLIDVMNQLTDYNIDIHYENDGKDIIDKVTANIPQTIFELRKGEN